MKPVSPRRRWIAAAAIGWACHLLQPDQPQSVIATVLVLLSFYLLDPAL